MDNLFSENDKTQQFLRGKNLILKCQTKIAADDILIFYVYLSKKIGLIFHMNLCLAEDSLETSS